MCRLPAQRPQPKQNGQMRQAHRQQRQRITRTRRRPQAAVQRNQSAGDQQNRQIQRIRRRCNGAREKLHERGKGKPHERRRQQMYIIAAGRLLINPSPSAARKIGSAPGICHRKIPAATLTSAHRKRIFFMCRLLYFFCASFQAFTPNGNAISSTASSRKPIFQPRWISKYTAI